MKSSSDGDVFCQSLFLKLLSVVLTHLYFDIASFFTNFIYHDNLQTVFTCCINSRPQIND